MHLLETDSERNALSAVSDKHSPSYENVPEVLSLPPPPDEGGDESDQEDNSSSVSSASHSDIQKLTCILMEFIEKLTVATTPPSFHPLLRHFLPSHFSLASATTAGCSFTVPKGPGPGTCDEDLPPPPDFVSPSTSHHTPTSFSVSSANH